jgi:hypothetical protein
MVAAETEMPTFFSSPSDSHVAPTRVLLGESQNKAYHLICDSRSTGLPLASVCPLASDEIAVPAKQRRG